MRNKVILATMAIGVSLMFNGCATALQDNVQGALNAIDAPFKPIAKALNDSYDATFGTNSVSKSTDNLEPWNVKKSKDTHYTLDVFFALPTAHSKSEASSQIDEILGNIKNGFEKWGRAENKKLMPLRNPNGMCDWVYKAEINKGVVSISEVEPSCGHGGTHRYIKFKALKINKIYYMVVESTNARNTNIFGSLHDAAIMISRSDYSDDNFILPEYNYQLSYTITAFINLIAQKRGDNKYVDIQLDSKNRYAKKYRDNFVNYFKRSLK